jgi:hypothetical protein
LKKTTKRIQYLVSEINRRKSIENKPEHNDYIIVITFSFDSFYGRCSSISNFFKVLTNGRNTHAGMNDNRDWFKSLRANGFYRYNITRDIVEITLVIRTLNKIDEGAFKQRVEKIIKPLNLVIGYNDKYLLNKKFIDVLSLETGMELFGGYKNDSTSI